MRVVQLMSLVIVACFLIGCSSGKPNNRKAVVGLKDVRTELAKCKAAVDQVQTSLAGLQPGDLKGTYDKLATSITALKAEAEDTSELAREMGEQSRSYIAAWERDVDEVQGADIASDSASRRAAVQVHFDAIRTSADAVRNSYRKYIDLLADVQTALTNDLTPAGLTMAGNATKAAFAEGNVLKGHLDDVTARIDKVYAGITK